MDQDSTQAWMTQVTQLTRVCLLLGFIFFLASVGCGMGADDETELAGTRVSTTQPLQSHVWALTAELAPPSPSQNLGFGLNVRMDGNHAVVCAGGRPRPSTWIHWYYFDNGLWRLQTTYEFEAPATNDPQFCGTLVIKGGLTFVGAPGVSGGRVLVFSRLGDGSWVQQDLIEEAEARAFGSAIAYDGVRVAISDTGYMDWNDSVRVYRRTESGWILEKKLQDPDGWYFDEYGRYVAIEGNWLAVGAVEYSKRVKNEGAVYLYERLGEGWVAGPFLQPPLEDEAQDFGRLAMSGDVLAVTAYEPAMTYVYRRTNQRDWVLEAKLAAGGRVGLDGNRLLSLAPSGLENVEFEYDGSSWHEIGNVGVGGWSWFLSGNRIIYGISSSSLHGPGAGVVKIYESGPPIPLGQACEHDGFCSTDFCVDGFCCDQPCDGICETCSSLFKGGGRDGECGPVWAGLDPRDDCKADVPGSCGPDGSCDGKGQCRLYALAGYACGETVCEDGRVSGSICDGKGFCSHGAWASCEPYACKGDVCGQDCVSDEDCSGLARCSPGGLCLTGAVCDGEHTILLGGGETLNCAPYKCQPNGICADMCGAVDDCVEPGLCNRERRCVMQEGHGSDGGGCQCGIPTRGGSVGWPVLCGFMFMVCFSCLRRKRHGLRWFVLYLGLVVFVFTGQAEAGPGWVRVDRWDSPLGEETRSFGHEIVLGEGTAIVSGEQEGHGFVAIYERFGEGWHPTQTLRTDPSDPVSPTFSQSLGLDGDWLAVGAAPSYSDHPPTPDQETAVFLYRNTDSAWVLAQRLEVPVAKNESEAFGISLAIRGNTLLVGSTGKGTYPGFPGRVFVYEQKGGDWIYVQTLPEAIDATARFGRLMALGEGWCAVGDGSWIFRRKEAGWVDGPHFEPSIHERLAAGTEWLLASTRSPRAVSTYLLDSSSFVFVSNLEDPDTIAESSNFGTSLTVDGNKAVVGASSRRLFSNNSTFRVPGRAYLYELNGTNWILRETLEGLDGQWNFGSSVSVFGDYLLVGEAPRTVHLFQKILPKGIGSPCAYDKTCESGFCVDGFCCESACDGECQACSNERKGNGEDGTCGPVAAGTDPRGDCKEDPAFPISCGADGTCNGLGACRHYAPAGTPCGATKCTNSVVSGQICDGWGECGEAVSAVCTYRCEGDVCGTTCQINEDCAESATCTSAGTCVSHATCDGEHTVSLPGGGTVDCSPYRCTQDGTCLMMCTAVEDCVEPYVCNHQRACIPLPNRPEETRGGCGCSPVSSAPGSSIFLGLLLAVCGLGFRRYSDFMRRGTIIKDS